jgi:hypothetical protein
MKGNFPLLLLFCNVFRFSFSQPICNLGLESFPRANLDCRYIHNGNYTLRDNFPRLLFFCNVFRFSFLQSNRNFGLENFLRANLGCRYIHNKDYKMRHNFPLHHLFCNVFQFSFLQPNYSFGLKSFLRASLDYWYMHHQRPPKVMERAELGVLQLAQNILENMRSWSREFNKVNFDVSIDNQWMLNC